MKTDLRNTGTRERIIQEACQLIQLGGINNLNLDQIARSLNITRPALYFHFPGGKDQLLIEVFKTWGTEMAKQLDETVRESPNACTCLRKIMLGVTSQPFPDLRELILAKLEHLTEQAQQELKEVFLKPITTITGVIQEGINKGELKNVDPNIAFYSFMGMHHQLEQYQILRQQLPPHVASKFPESVEVMANKLMDLWFGGMLASGTCTFLLFAPFLNFRAKIR